MRRATVVFAALLAIGLAGCSVASGAQGARHPAAQGTTVAHSAHREAATTTARPGTTVALADERTGESTTAEGRPDASSGLVTAIGDSAMLGAVGALEQDVPNLVLIDAQGSRQVTAAIDLMKQYRAAGHLGDTVIVHIGNNGLFTADQFDEMMRVLSGVRKVLIVNLTVPPGVEGPVAVPNDAVLAAGARRYKKAVLVDWYSASSGHPRYLWDGIHLTPTGARAYARLISSDIEAPKGRVPGPRKTFYFGGGAFSGECIGPPSWCLPIKRYLKR